MVSRGTRRVGLGIQVGIIGVKTGKEQRTCLPRCGIGEDWGPPTGMEKKGLPPEKNSWGNCAYLDWNGL